MKVYIAAPYGARAQARRYAEKLLKHGHIPTCTWAFGDRPITAGTVHTATELDDAHASKFARGDLDDIAQCDIFVLLTESVAEIEAGGAGSGGRHIETGYAIAMGKRVYVVGEPENIFHRSDDLVHRVATWGDCLNQICAARPANSSRGRAPWG